MGKPAEILEIPATITERGQTTVPAAVRKMLGLGKRGRVVFRGLSDGTVVIAKAKEAGQALSDQPGGAVGDADAALAQIATHALSRPILVDVTAGDTIALLTPGRLPADPPAPPTGDLQWIASEVAAASPGQGSFDAAAALAAAADVLAVADASADRRIYLVTDRQAANWATVDAPFAADWGTRASGGGAAPPRPFPGPLYGS